MTSKKILFKINKYMLKRNISISMLLKIFQHCNTPREKLMLVNSKVNHELKLYLKNIKTHASIMIIKLCYHYLI